jgi:hypothetical protein
MRIHDIRTLAPSPSCRVLTKRATPAGLFDQPHLRKRPLSEVPDAPLGWLRPVRAIRVTITGFLGQTLYSGIRWHRRRDPFNGDPREAR